MRKYLISAIISLGLLCSPISLLTITYKCTGQDVFPTYYASPFIYKSTSQATSLAYDFYVVGFFANILIWFILLLVARLLVVNTILKSDSKIMQFLYKTLKYGLVIFSIVCVIFISTTGGNTIKTSINLNQEAKTWGMNCNGTFYFIE